MVLGLKSKHHFLNLTSGTFQGSLYHLRLSAAFSAECLVEFFCKLSNIGGTASNDISVTSLICSYECSADSLTALAGIIYGYDAIPAEWLKDLRRKDLIDKYLFQWQKGGLASFSFTNRK